MKIATQRVLAGGLLLAGIAYACATPVEIEGCQPTAPGAQNCDVILSQSSDFGGPDASVPAQGGSAGSNSNPPPSGNAGSGNNPPPEGGAGSGSAGSGSGSAGSGSAGSGSAGSSGGQGGAAGSGSAGSGSAGTGSAGTGSAGTGSGGTGSSNFNLGSCDLQNRNGCEEFACDTACPAGGAGNYCRSNCALIVACVAADDSCITEADPMCGTPSQNPYTENQCTSEVNSSQSPDTVGTPSNVARALIRCLCSNPRP
ncbi:MAG: hypothetical protein RL033_8012 [Pseudomonadota bacterium]